MGSGAKMLHLLPVLHVSVPQSSQYLLHISLQASPQLAVAVPGDWERAGMEHGRWLMALFLLFTGVATRVQAQMSVGGECHSPDVRPADWPLA